MPRFHKKYLTLNVTTNKLSSLSEATPFTKREKNCTSSDAKKMQKKLNAPFFSCRRKYKKLTPQADSRQLPML